MTLSEEQNKQLNAPLDPASVKQREGARGRMLSYLEGWRAIQNANDIFGFDGWSTEVTNLQCVESSQQGNPNYEGRDNKGYLVAYVARVKVTVGIDSHEDVGYGEDINYGNVGQAHESAIKEAVTDAEKRALRHWGNQFGLSLYDKDAPKPAQAAQKAPQQGSDSSDERKVTENQLKRLWAIAASKGVGRDRVKQVLDADYRIKSPEELTRSQYDHIIGRLQATPEPAAEPEQPPVMLPPWSGGQVVPAEGGE